MGKDNGARENGKEFDAKTFLYIRTNPADDGSVPLAAGLAGWVSPDITIIRPGGIRGTEAAADEAEKVEVVVTNGGGIDATDAYVDVFVADPCTAFTPATAQLIGGDFLSIPNHNTASVTLPWTPTAADAGHRCLLARVCLSFPPDCYADPTVFDVLGDRHVAQRNISVVKLTGSSLTFGLLIVDPMKEAAGNFDLRVAEVTGTGDVETFRRALGSPDAQFAKAPLPAIGLELGDLVPARGTHDETGQLVKPPTGVLEKPRSVTRLRTAGVQMKRDERRYATITVARNPDNRPGDLHVVELRQVDLRTKRTVGGLWLVIQQ